jgi:hypothetical protein
MQRQAINNSTFRNEYEIGKIVFDWTCNYNEKHGRRITDILQIGVSNDYDYITVKLTEP